MKNRIDRHNSKRLEGGKIEPQWPQTATTSSVNKMNLAASETGTCGNHFHSVQATTFSEKLNKALRMKAGLQTRSIQLRATNKKLQRHKKRCICVNSKQPIRSWEVGTANSFWSINVSYLLTITLLSEWTSLLPPRCQSIIWTPYFR